MGVYSFLPQSFYLGRLFYQGDTGASKQSAWLQENRPPPFWQMNVDTLYGDFPKSLPYTEKPHFKKITLDTPL